MVKKMSARQTFSIILLRENLQNRYCNGLFRCVEWLIGFTAASHSAGELSYGRGSVS